MANSYQNIPVPTPTQNPVPSADIRDHVFAGSKLDEFVTSMGWTYTDRFGGKHYTVEGLRWLAQQAISQYGYITLDSFESGNEITLPNQALRLEATGEYYRWDGELPKTVPSDSTPESTGGVGPGAWVGIGDAALRAQLAKTDGFKLVGECPDIDTLRTIEPNGLGQLIRIENYYSDKFGGGGFFRSVNPGALVDDGCRYIVTIGGAVWERVVMNGVITTADAGCFVGNVGPDNSARLVKACASGYDVLALGENYDVTSVPSSNFKLAGRFTASINDFSTDYGRTLLTLTGSKVNVDIDIDMKNFGAGGFNNKGTDTSGVVRVSNIYGADRATFGLQDAVTDSGTRSELSIIVRNIQKGDSGVDPQPAAFTIATGSQRGNYPNISIYESQGGVIVANTTEIVIGTLATRRVHDNGIYCLSGSRVDIGSMVCDNVLGELWVNAGGILNIGHIHIRECSGFGGTFSYSGDTRIGDIYVDNALLSSVMPLISSRQSNVKSSLWIGSIKGRMVLPTNTASILNSFLTFAHGDIELYIGDVDLTFIYVAGSYLGLADFSACSSLILGNWTLTFVDTTGTLTSANVAFLALPVNTKHMTTGSRVGTQMYISSSATVRMNNIDNDSIDFSVGQPIQVNAGPCITSAVTTPVRIFHATSLPTVGKWFSGDKIFIITPGSSVKLGWVCTQTGDFSGTPPVFQLIV